MLKTILFVLLISILPMKSQAEVEEIAKQSNFDKLSEFIQDLVPYYLTDLSTLINPTDAVASFINITSPYITYPEQVEKIYDYLPVFGDWKFYITPTLDVIYNNVDNYINLEADPLISSYRPQEGDLRNYRLIIKDYKNKNLRVRKKQLDIAVGAKLHLPPELISSIPVPIAPFFGIMPAGGRTKTAYQISNTFSEAEDRSFPNIPRTSEEALSLREGELVSYMATGGITFNAGISCYGLTLGASALAIGEWQVAIKRLENSLVEVSYLNNDLKHFNLFASFVVLSSSIAFFSSYQHSLSFKFDLTDALARDAFEEMLKGNLLRADHYRKNLNNEHITQIEVKSIDVKGVKTNHAIKVPLIYRQSLSNNMIQIAEDIVDSTDENSMVLWRGAFLSRVDKKILLTKSSEVEAFLGTVVKKPEFDRNFSAQIIINYEHQRTKHKHLTRMFKRMINKVGLAYAVEMQIPDSDDFPERKIGFTGLRLTLDFSRDAINSIINIGSDEEMTNQFAQRPIHLVEAYIRTNLDQKKDPNLACMRSSMASSKSWNQCKKSIRNSAESTYKKLRELLPKISTLAKELNQEDKHLSTKALMADKLQPAKQEKHNKLSRMVGQFGELVLSDPFMFQTLFQFSKNYGVTMNYQIYGEKLSYVNRTLTWPQRAIEE